MHIRKNFPDYELIRIEDTITDSTKISQEIENDLKLRQEIESIKQRLYINNI